MIVSPAITQNFNYPLFMFPSSLTFQQPIILFRPCVSSSTQQGELKNQEPQKSREIEVKKEEKDQEVSIPISKGQQRQSQAHKQTRKREEEDSLLKQPQKRKKQMDSFTEKRNIIPNNINHILSHIQRKSKSENLTQKIIAKLGGENKFTVKRFYCYQTFIKQQLHIHVNRQTLRDIINHLDLNESIFSVEQQLFFNRVSRILIFHYLRELAKLKILSSQRVKLTNKLDHLHAQRFLLNFLLNSPQQ